MVEPLAYMEIAQRLAAARSAGEPEIRTAINRAYLAIHLKAQWGLERAGIYSASRSAADHGGVIRALRANRRTAAAEALNGLRALRERADYEVDIFIARSHWVEADRLSQLAKRLLQPDWA